MRRILLGLVAAGALLAPAAAQADLCSPLKKNCVWGTSNGGGNPVTLGIRTYEPIAQYKLCITDPKNRVACWWRSLTPQGGGLASGTVRYTGAWIGTYHARWYRPDGTQLAPYWWWPSGLTFVIYR